MNGLNTNRINMHVYNHYIRNHLLMDQTLLVEDGLNKKILHEDEIENYSNEKIKQWYLIGYALSNELSARGETVMRGTCGTWWGIKESQEYKYISQMPVIHDICNSGEKEALAAEKMAA